MRRQQSENSERERKQQAGTTTKRDDRLNLGLQRIPSDFNVVDARSLSTRTHVDHGSHRL